MHKLLVIIAHIIVCAYADFTGFDNEAGAVENNNDNNINLEYKPPTLRHGAGISCVIRPGDFTHVAISNDFFNRANLPAGFVNVNLEVTDFASSARCKAQLESLAPDDTLTTLITGAANCEIDQGGVTMVVYLKKNPEEIYLKNWRCGYKGSGDYVYKTLALQKTIKGQWGDSTDADSPIHPPLITLAARVETSTETEITLTCQRNNRGVTTTYFTGAPFKTVEFTGAENFRAKGDLYGRDLTPSVVPQCVINTPGDPVFKFKNLGPEDYSSKCYSGFLSTTLPEIKPKFTLLRNPYDVDFNGYEPNDVTMDFDTDSLFLFDRNVNMDRVVIDKHPYMVMKFLKPRNFHETPLLNHVDPNQPKHTFMTSISFTMLNLLLGQQLHKATAIQTVEVIKNSGDSASITCPFDSSVEEYLAIFLLDTSTCSVSLSNRNDVVQYNNSCVDPTNFYLLSSRSTSNDQTFTIDLTGNEACISKYATCIYKKKVPGITNILLLPADFASRDKIPDLSDKDVDDTDNCEEDPGLIKTLERGIRLLTFSDSYSYDYHLDQYNVLTGDGCAQLINPCEYDTTASAMKELGRVASVRVPIRFLNKFPDKKIWQCSMYDTDSDKMSWNEMRDNVACSGTELYKSLITPPKPSVYRSDENNFKISCGIIHRSCINKGINTSAVLSGTEIEDTLLEEGEEFTISQYDLLIKNKVLKCETEWGVGESFISDLLPTNSGCSVSGSCVFIDINTIRCFYDSKNCYSHNINNVKVVFRINDADVPGANVKLSETNRFEDGFFHFLYPVASIVSIPTKNTIGFKLVDEWQRETDEFTVPYPTVEQWAFILESGIECDYTELSSAVLDVSMGRYTGETTITLQYDMYNFPECKRNENETSVDYYLQIRGEIGTSSARREDEDKSMTEWKNLVYISVHDDGDGVVTWQPISNQRDYNLDIFDNKILAAFRYRLTQEKITELFGPYINSLEVRVITESLDKGVYEATKEYLDQTMAYRTLMIPRIPPQPPITTATTQPPIDVMITTQSPNKPTEDEKSLDLEMIGKIILLIAFVIVFVILLTIGIITLVKRHRETLPEDEYLLP
uniref:Uncharacterized protein n=1 Tax=Ostreid herpesvirus 1 TaxID=261939 RepID=V9QMV6_OSHV1|nr:hypothetical protein [Ostreid herpesvirus 1]